MKNGKLAQKDPVMLKRKRIEKIARECDRLGQPLYPRMISRLVFNTLAPDRGLSSRIGVLLTEYMGYVRDEHLTSVNGEKVHCYRKPSTSYEDLF